MKTTLVSTLLLSLALAPAIVRADDPKPADPPKAEEPKKEEPKKEEPKKEEPKKEEPKKEEPKTDEAKPKPKPQYEEQKSDDAEAQKKEEQVKDAPAQDKWSRETPEILKSWEPALEDVRKATVKIVRDGKDIAYGCAVHENGYIITKATELHDKKNALLTNLEVVFPEGLRLPLKLSDIHRQYDLALLKVEAKGLRTMKWDESAQPSLGTFLAAATPMRLPAAVGVVSVLPRSMDDVQKGYLGVGLDKGSDGIIKIISVSSSSPASKAGLVIDDIIKTIDGKTLNSVEECIKTIGSCRPYQKLKIVVGREKGDRELEVTLASRATNVAQGGEDPRNMMAGQLSSRRRGFPDALQHDMVLDPQEVGGPLVDLDGKVVGINIARSGRIECVAIPSKTVKTLLSKVTEGKFFHPELDAMREERKGAEEALARLKKDLETINGRIKEAEGPPEKKTEEEGVKEKEKEK